MRTMRRRFARFTLALAALLAGGLLPVGCVTGLRDAALKGLNTFVTDSTLAFLNSLSPLENP